MNSPRPSESADLTPRKAVILVGAGGTGAKAVTEVARALEMMGEKFGKPIGETGAIVHAVVLDGDERTWKETDDNPDAAVLNASGARKIHLFDRNQTEFIRKNGIADLATPELHSAADPQGCNADPRSSRVRYLNQRELADPASNPRTMIRDLALELINLDSGVTLGEVVELIYVGGMHGGTGPVLLDVAADANAIVTDVLGQGASSRAIRSFAYLMSSESAELAPSMGRNLVQSKKRRRNAAVTSMRADEATVTGGVTMMNGARLNGVPFQYLHIVNGRSGEKAVRDHYGPIGMVAKAIVSQILERGGVDSAMSNVELGIMEPTLDMERLPKNRIAMGVSELAANPSRGLLRYQKQKAALEQATGVSTVDSAEVTRRLGQVGLNEILNRVLLGLQLPSIDRTDFGALDKVGANTPRVITEFKGELPGLTTKVEEKVRAAVKESWEAVKQFAELRAQRKLGTLVDATDRLSAAVIELVDSLNTSVEALRRELGAYQTNLNEAAAHLGTLKYDAWLPGTKRKQEEAIRAAQDSVESAADRYAKATAKLAATELLITEITRHGGLQANIERTRSYAEGLKGNVEAVDSSIKPEETLTSPFDLEVIVPTPDFAHAGDGLTPGGYTVPELKALVDGVQLAAEEVDLRTHLRDPRVQAEIARRAAPLIVAPSKADHADKEPFKEVTVPVMGSDTFAVAADGTIRNAKADLGIDDQYTVRATAPNGPVVMQERLFGLGALDCQYMRGLIKEMITEVLESQENVAAIERHFSMKGDMERLLPVYAAALAEDELKRDGGKGETREQEIPGRGVILKVYKTEADLAREARLAAARQPKKA